MQIRTQQCCIGAGGEYRCQQGRGRAWWRLNHSPALPKPFLATSTSSVAAWAGSSFKYQTWIKKKTCQSFNYSLLVNRHFLHWGHGRFYHSKQHWPEPHGILLFRLHGQAVNSLIPFWMVLRPSDQLCPRLIRVPPEWSMPRLDWSKPSMPVENWERWAGPPYKDIWLLNSLLWIHFGTIQVIV